MNRPSAVDMRAKRAVLTNLIKHAVTPRAAVNLLCRVTLLIVFLSGIGLAAHAQISPGPLSRPHQTLEGATHCTSCHQIGAKRELKCLECHTEIASRLKNRRGLHASYNLQPDSSQGCAKCHSEHNGVDFPLIKWTPTPTAFDHSQTGYALQGKHAGLTCNRCHTADHVAASERFSIQVRDRNKTFLGIPQTCTTCHKDEHNGRLGANCQQCHNFEDWKDVSQFDHSKTKYPLTGLHAQVACQKCHTPGPDNKPRFVGLAFGKCNDCHADPHHGSFGEKTCQSCHNTGGWRRVSLQAVSQNFDHSKTKYPLQGKHQEVSCMQCHTSGDFKKPLVFDKCTSCHKDEHNGQFVKRADAGQCSSCHTVAGFKPSTFTVKEHAQTAYPLQFKHAQVQCSGCHIPKGKATLYLIKFDKCTNCHKDEHQGQFASAPYLNQCELCHNLKGYRPSTFTLAEHKKTRFPLTGAHLPTPCNECHKERATPQFEKAVVFKFDDRSCTTCHEDLHKGQFKKRMLQVRADGSPVGCQACHSTESWKDLRGFDHAQTDFPLVGAHRATACMDCHKPPAMETSLIHVDFAAAPTRCEQCHEDIHGAQFAKSGGVTSCADCHKSASWKPSLFDHETRTSFSLKGAHQNVRCAACHKNVQSVAGKSVLFYKPTPKQCAACHGPAPTKS